MTTSKRCPVCFASMWVYCGMDGARARPGDFLVCNGCTAVLSYDSGMVPVISSLEEVKRSSGDTAVSLIFCIQRSIMMQHGVKP